MLSVAPEDVSKLLPGQNTEPVQWNSPCSQQYNSAYTPQYVLISENLEKKTFFNSNISNLPQDFKVVLRLIRLNAYKEQA